MNPDNRPTPPNAPAEWASASVRLARNRERLAAWLEQDRVAQAQPSLGGWAARSVLPLITGLRQHPTASLALGALLQAWMRPSTATAVARPLALESQALGVALSVVRKHPRITVTVAAIAGVAWWWNRSRSRASSPP